MRALPAGSEQFACPCGAGKAYAQRFLVLGQLQAATGVHVTIANTFFLRETGASTDHTAAGLKSEERGVRKDWRTAD